MTPLEQVIVAALRFLLQRARNHGPLASGKEWCNCEACVLDERLAKEQDACDD